MRSVFFLLLLCAACLLPAAAADPHYVRIEMMIPMRDGVRLHAVVLRPAKGEAHAGERLPILLNRTPYGVAKTTPEAFVKRYPEFAAAGYIFAQEDIRGRFGSEGSFVMMRPLAAHHDAQQYPREIDESTDAYDTVAWLVEHVPQNSGRVGVLGVSYDGFLTTMAGIDPHPAVKAISPQAPMTDVWQGDDFFHNGAFRQTYGYDYAIGMEGSKENGFGKLDRDAYDYFLSAGSFRDAITKSGNNMLPTWQGFLAHPTDDAYWQQRSVLPHLDRVAVPTLEVGGWWDQEDMWGPQAQYAALKPHDAEHRVYLVVGPWNHGQWRGPAASLGALAWGQATGTTYRAEIEEPFFEHYLRPERGTPWTVQAAVTFQTGTNTWRHYDAWPPASQTRVEPLYLGPAQTLGFDQPASKAVAAAVASAEEATTYTSDPAHPVPYRARPIEATYAPTGSHWYTWLAEDQRPSTARADVASWKTAVLDRSVTVTGEITADLFASTSGTDSDWVVKLIDVYPDDATQGKMAGYQLMIAEEIFRGRYRTSVTAPAPLVAGSVEEYTFSLHGADHVFLPGHRLMVQVQSSWFPLYDRNPQTFVPNIMEAQPGDYQAATEKIYWSAKYPSHMDLPVARGR